MSKKNCVVVIAFGILLSFLISTGYGQEQKALFQLTIKADKEEYQVGEDIRIVFLIENNSDRDIDFEGFSIESNLSNSEVSNCDILGKRNGVTIALKKPEMHIPVSLSGPKRWTIHRGEALEITQLLNKWTTAEGKSISESPGVYELQGKVSNVSLESYTKMTLFSTNRLTIKVVEAKAEICNVRITVFGDGTAFWEEEREVKLKEGLNKLEFSDIPSTIESSSMVIKSLSAPESFKVVETSLTTPSTSPQQRKISGLVVSARAGWHKLKLLYKVRGLSAIPRYISLLSSNKQDTMDLKGWVSISNNCGTAIKEAAIYLPAERISSLQCKGAGSEIYSYRSPSTPQSKNVDTALYLVPTPVSLEVAQTKNFEFASLSKVPFTKFNLYDGLPVQAFSVPRARNYERSRISRDYSMRNRADCVKVVYELDTLKIKIPQSGLLLTDVQVYQLGTKRFLVEKGHLQFNKLTSRYQLVTGPHPGLLGRRRQVDFKEIIPGESCEETIETGIQNNTAKIQKVRIHEHLLRSETYKILKYSKQYLEVELGLLEFLVEVEPGKSSTVTYTVRYEY